MRIYNKADILTALVTGELEGKFHRMDCRCCVLLSPSFEFSFVLNGHANRRIHWLSAVDWIMGKRRIPERPHSLFESGVGDWNWYYGSCGKIHWRWRELIGGMYHL